MVLVQRICQNCGETNIINEKVLGTKKDVDDYFLNDRATFVERDQHECWNCGETL